jgi:hypothetical protein
VMLLPHELDRPGASPPRSSCVDSAASRPMTRTFAGMVLPRSDLAQSIDRQRRRRVCIAGPFRATDLLGRAVGVRAFFAREPLRLSGERRRPAAAVTPRATLARATSDVALFAR